MKDWLQHPVTRGLALDDPRTTLGRRTVIQRKGFLRQIYCEWYERIAAELPPYSNTVLELGSGPGFIRDYIPQAITSEVFEVQGVDRIEDAHRLRFDDATLDAIVMTDVLHHIPNVRNFFGETVRVLKENGRLIMVEPWRTPWSRFVYQNLHHEPFLDEATEWALPDGGPLSNANGALPWIIFGRDRAQFNRDYPQLVINTITPLMPLSYLASGGLATRFGFPRSSYHGVRAIEKMLLGERGAMFALISVTRTERSSIAH